MIQQYIENITTRYKSGIAREHSYRADLQQLLESLAPELLATNEPARIACGAPDFILTSGAVPVGYIEAKDIGVSLDKAARSEQMQRYTASLDNLILTDYLEFRLFRQGKFVRAAALAEIKNGAITPLPEQWSDFADLMQEFCAYQGQTITSAQKLAETMAGKARMMQTVIEQALTSDEAHEQNSSLQDQMLAFKRILIHDITPAAFADIYAQTIAYGMFAARLHDPTLDNFSRQEAAELIPKTNPFLRKLFSYIAGVDIDDRILWIVDALAEVFRATNVAALMQHFGKATQMRDPVIHFYETFLAAYNPKLRKSRGVWYTPEPVVNFIVRAVDEILKAEFDLPQGLADTSKTIIDVDTQIEDKRSKTGYKREKQAVHKVQILDPAAGTGTFLAEVIKRIYAAFAGQQGMWSNYVEEHLIPRLHGFEILMASYAMAHLKLELLLRETGYTPKQPQRFRIFLTNSLEEAHPDTGTLFASWLSREATEANYIKRDTPVMVVLGNPPYSVSSSNKGTWIKNLLDDYKEGLNEKNINPLSDDYIKFIRYGQYFIEKNGEGILAFISNNSFIDGLIHRQMRKSLLETFNTIYILDLHGNANKKETAPDGGKDENVFDIQQGVSINIFVNNSHKKKGKYVKVWHCDLYGKRVLKYQQLTENSFHQIQWENLRYNDPDFFFVPKDFKLKKQYDTYISLKDIYKESNVGINTEFDGLAIQDSLENANQLLNNLQNLEAEQVLVKYDLEEKNKKKIFSAINDIKRNSPMTTTITYRPFDDKHTVYTGASNGIMGRPRHNVMKHMLVGDNVGLVSMRQYAYKVPSYCYTFITKNIVASRLFISNKGYCSIFPLYLYSEETPQYTLNGVQERTPNLSIDVIKMIGTKIGLRFTSEKEDTAGTFAPIDLLDYIYAVLHSPTYRETYKEFLKIDFPRIPYPKDQDTFWQLAAPGAELRQLHLLEHPKVQDFITAYPQDGDNKITRKISKKAYEITDSEGQRGRVWISDAQYFDNVPRIAWEFYIGGYQPAQKWLKDRHGRRLNFDDIRHYQKMIVALTETNRLMQEIDKVDFLE